MEDYFSKLADNTETRIRPMLTVSQVARLMNIHVNNLRRWSDNNIVRSYRINSRGDRRYRPDDIARFMSQYNNFNQGNGKHFDLTGK